MPNSKADRLMILAQELQASRMGLTLQDIEKQFGVCRRTAQRLTAAVSEHFPTTEEWLDDGGRKRWRIPKANLAPIEDVTADELADLAFVVRQLRKTNDSRRASSLESLARKIKSRLSANVSRRIDPDFDILQDSEEQVFRPGPKVRIREEVLSALREAIKAGSQVRITHYNRARQSRSERIVCPYGILSGERGYLVAASPERPSDEPRLFGLPEIEKAEILNRVFTRDPNFSLKAFAERSFGVYQEPQRDVVWHFSPSAAERAREYVFHPSQTVETLPDGGLMVRFRAGGLIEMAEHLQRWGNEVQVIEPPELKDLLAGGARSSKKDDKI